MTDTDLVERLRGLIQRLEKLEGPDRLTDANILWAISPGAFEADCGEDEDHLKPSYCYARDGWSLNRADHAHLDTIPVPRLTASLDAAIALVERLGFVWLKKSQEAMTVYRPLTPEQDERKEWAVHHGATGATSAIALVLALLRALSQEPSK